MQKLSFIFPCYNEEEVIPHLKEKLDPVLEQLKEKYETQVIFVDDGSKDKTNELLHQTFDSYSNVTIIKHEKNQNLGGAIRTGFKHASGDIIATLDSDCTFPPELVPKMLEILDNSCSIVTVSPYHPQGTVESTDKFRIFLSKVISLFYRTILNSGIYTHGAIARIYKKEVIENVPFKGYNFLSVTEFLVRAILAGYKVKELPCALKKREFGVSKIRLVPVIKDHINLIYRILRYKLFKKPL